MVVLMVIQLYISQNKGKRLKNPFTLVVSASSDRTIKVWKPYSDTPKTAHTVGWHTDYAKCLTYASGQGWVASGGLDRKIKIWDLNQSEAILSINAGPVNLSTDGSNDSKNPSIFISTQRYLCLLFFFFFSCIARYIK